MSCAMPSEQEMQTKPAGEDLLSRFVRGNYFYFLSAAFMLLGSYLFMNSEYVVGTVFAHTLKTLLILQAYELLVILTALVIVRKLGVLDDAFSLLIIELILLLDPTFFGNSFATMLRTQATAVNVACFLLAPLKLAILARYLEFRIAPRAIAAFMFAAAFVYLIENPVNHVVPFEWISRPGYYYFLTWLPLAFIALLPHGRIRFVQNHEFCAERRRKALDTLICMIPLAILFLHLVEDAVTHEFKYYMFYAAPLVIACAALLVKSVDAGRVKLPNALRAVDALCVVAAILALGWFDDFWKKSGVIYSWAREIKPDFAVAHVPVIACGAGIAATYFYFYHRFQYRPALRRLAVLMLAGIGLALKLDAVQARVASILRFARGCLGWLDQRSDHIREAVLAWLAPAAAFFAAHCDELIGAAVLIALVALHLRKAKPKPGLVYFLAGLGAACGLHRFVFQPEFWCAAVVGIEVALLLAASFMPGYRGYRVIAAAQAVIFAPVILYRAGHPAEIIWVVLVVMAAVAIARRNLLLGYAAGCLLLWLMFRLLPFDSENWIPERLQAILILSIAVNQVVSRNPDDRWARYFMAMWVALLSLIRFADSCQVWSGAVVCFDVIGLVIAGYFLFHFGYIVIAAMLAAAYAYILANLFHVHLSAGAIAVAVACVLYAIGLVVTFNKQRFIGWISHGQAVKAAGRKETGR